MSMDCDQDARIQKPAIKPLTELPPYSQDKAHKAKAALSLYFALVRSGFTKGEASTRARALWLELLGDAICDRQLRRRLARVNAGGGPNHAAIEFYADRLSVPHRKKQI